MTFIRFRARRSTLATTGNDEVPAGITGLSIPDAIAIGTIIAAMLAARFGGKQGEAAKQDAIKAAAGVSIAGSIVDAAEFGNYIKAIDKLAIAMDRHADALDRQHEVKHTNALEALAEKVDEVRAKMEPRRPKPRHR